MAHMSLGESYSCHLNKHIFVMLGKVSNFILLGRCDPVPVLGNLEHLVQFRTMGTKVHPVVSNVSAGLQGMNTLVTDLATV